MFSFTDYVVVGVATLCAPADWVLPYSNALAVIRRCELTKIVELQFYITCLAVYVLCL
ncbi:hypothetical protein J6590_044237 [Homalodisca vitripennis]|nr:hypothetical protein J6590_044237 [Homalodisca vitripennis]